VSFLTKEQILAAQNRRTTDVEIPELGGTLRVRAPSAAWNFRAKAMKKRLEKGEEVELELMAEMLEAACVDQKNKPIFDREGAKAALDAMDIETINKIVSAFHELAAPKAKTAPAPAAASGGHRPGKLTAAARGRGGDLPLRAVPRAALPSSGLPARGAHRRAARRLGAPLPPPPVRIPHRRHAHGEDRVADCRCTGGSLRSAARLHDAPAARSRRTAKRRWSRRSRRSSWPSG
jgi:hypothetical protein